MKEDLLKEVASQFLADRIDKGIAHLATCAECEGAIIVDNSPPKRAYHSQPYCNGWNDLAKKQEN